MRSSPPRRPCALRWPPIAAAAPSARAASPRWPLAALPAATPSWAWAWRRPHVLTAPASIPLLTRLAGEILPSARERGVGKTVAPFPPLRPRPDRPLRPGNDLPWPTYD